MSILLSRRAICAGLVVMGLSTAAMAAHPQNAGLGQAWPNARDLSSSTHWHVYAFVNDGVKYIQVNDLNGNIRGAFATANGQFLVLPMGSDARRISTPQKPASLSSTVVPLAALAELVYHDRTIKLVAVPVSDGTVLFEAASSRSLAPCDPDKEDCNTHLQANAASTLAAPSCDPDKEDCNTHLTATSASTLIAPSCDPDKEDCNTHLQVNAASTLAAPSCDPDKEDCNTHLTATSASTLTAPSCDPDKEDCNTHLR